MPYRFVRTAAGQAEIQSRALNLPRHVRNLLLIINATQEGGYWLAQVKQIRQMDYATLYEALNGYAKQALGLVRGYRFSLEVEKCAGPQELQALALRFIERVRAEQGTEALKRFGQMLAPR